MHLAVPFDPPHLKRGIFAIFLCFSTDYLISGYWRRTKYLIFKSTTTRKKLSVVSQSYLRTAKPTPRRNIEGRRLSGQPSQDAAVQCTSWWDGVWAEEEAFYWGDRCGRHQCAADADCGILHVRQPVARGFRNTLILCLLPSIRGHHFQHSGGQYFCLGNQSLTIVVIVLHRWPFVGVLWFFA